MGYVFGKGGNTIADVKAKAGVSITTDVRAINPFFVSIVVVPGSR